MSVFDELKPKPILTRPKKLSPFQQKNDNAESAMFFLVSAWESVVRGRLLLYKGTILFIIFSENCIPP